MFSTSLSKERIGDDWCASGSDKQCDIFITYAYQYLPNLFTPQSLVTRFILTRLHNDPDFSYFSYLNYVSRVLVYYARTGLETRIPKKQLRSLLSLFEFPSNL
jgi:hypothetical protein